MRDSRQVSFMHNGEEVNGKLIIDSYSKEVSYSFMLNYKGVNSIFLIERVEDFRRTAPLHCRIIDKRGAEGYKKYLENLATIYSIESKHIIVNNEVYNFFCKELEKSPKYYLLKLSLDNEKELNGTDSFTTIEDMGDAVKLKNNLQIQANYYFKNHNVKPSPEQLNKELTERFKTLKAKIEELESL